MNVTGLTADEWDVADPSPFVATLGSRPIDDVLTGEVRA